MTNFEIILAGAIILAAIIQIIVLILVYRSVSRLSSRANRLMDSLEPQIQEVAEGVHTIRGSLENSIVEVNATIAGVRATADALGRLAEEEGRGIARLVEKTTDMADRQVEETERALDAARARIAELGDGFDRNVLEPIRIILALMAAVRRGVESLAALRSGQRSDSDHPADVGSA